MLLLILFVFLPAFAAFKDPLDAPIADYKSIFTATSIQIANQIDTARHKMNILEAIKSSTLINKRLSTLRNADETTLTKLLSDNLFLQQLQDTLNKINETIRSKEAKYTPISNPELFQETISEINHLLEQIEPAVTAVLPAPDEKRCDNHLKEILDSATTFTHRSKTLLATVSTNHNIFQEQLRLRQSHLIEMQSRLWALNQIRNNLKSKTIATNQFTETIYEEGQATLSPFQSFEFKYSDGSFKYQWNEPPKVAAPPPSGIVYSIDGDGHHHCQNIGIGTELSGLIQLRAPHTESENLEKISGTDLEALGASKKIFGISFAESFSEKSDDYLDIRYSESHDTVYYTLPSLRFTLGYQSKASSTPETIKFVNTNYTISATVTFGKPKTFPFIRRMEVIHSLSEAKDRDFIWELPEEGVTF